MIETETNPVVTCPQCDGRGGGEGFINSTNGCSYGRITCSLCVGTGKVAAMVVERVRVGEIMRQERLIRHVSGREEAKRIGADMIALNYLETGRASVLHQFKEFRKDGWPFCPQCEEEELYSHVMLNYGGEGERPTLAQCYFGGFKCYRCSWESAK